jgi:hypothetical protein
MDLSGQIVTAIVERVAVFGLFLRHGADEILVRIPEVSWVACINSCHQFADVGDQVCVRVGGPDNKPGLFWGSIKRLAPDPWGSDGMAVGTVRSARVFRRVDQADRCEGRPGYLMEFEPGIYAMLCAGDRSFVLGDRIDMRITSSRPEANALRIALA